MTDQIILNCIEIIIAICIVIVTRYIVPWLKEKGYYATLIKISTIAEDFVLYAEKLIVGEKKGEERFKLVVKLLTQTINRFKLNYTEEQIAAIVQRAYIDVIGDSDNVEV